MITFAANVQREQDASVGGLSAWRTHANVYGGARRLLRLQLALWLTLLSSPALAAGRSSGLAAGRPHMHHVRRLFEPTDLQLQNPGTLGLDLQVGFIQGQQPARVAIPDFELNLGLMRNLEFDVDGSFALEGPSSGAYRYDHLYRDNLWTALKLGVYAHADVDTGRVFSVGLQLGPKLPVAPLVHGVGVEGLVLLAYSAGPLQLVANAGGLADPAADDGSGRPRGVEGGLDAAYALDATSKWALIAELGGIHFFSSDPPQLAGSFGASFSPNPALTWSLVALGGLMQGSDRYGLLLGIAPSFGLRRGAQAKQPRHTAGTPLR